MRQRPPREHRDKIGAVGGGSVEVAQERDGFDLAWVNGPAGWKSRCNASSMAWGRNTPEAPAPVTAARTASPVLATKTAAIA